VASTGGSETITSFDGGFDVPSYWPACCALSETDAVTVNMPTRAQTKIDRFMRISISEVQTRKGFLGENCLNI
jgi:hypothetical protein